MSIRLFCPHLVVLTGSMIAVMALPLTVSVYAECTPSFFGDHERGWHWYERYALRSQVERNAFKGTRNQDEQFKQVEKTNLSPKSPTDIVKAWREELEKKLHTALVYPTSQNLKAYQVMQKDMMERAKVFSTVWMQTVFQNPGLDHTLVSPVNQQARLLHIDLQKNQTSSVIKSLSKTWGLFFFFASNCPYCHQFAPIVKKFSDAYQWEVIAIRVADSNNRSQESGARDQGKQPLQDDIQTLFPNTQNDNGLFHAWGIKVLPSLFAVNPKTQETIPIAYGLTSIDEMENRIMTLMGGMR